MALITFLSDFGSSDHYTAAVKARILSINPSINVVDISHQIGHCDIAHASYVLSSLYNAYPKGTVHLVAVDATGNRNKKFIAMQLDDHYFVGPDNGVLSLLSDKEATMAVQINVPGGNENTTFAAKEILAPAAAKLASSGHLQDIGHLTKDYVKLIGRTARATKQQITGHVIRVDHYGNLITNILKTDFDILVKDRPYLIKFSRESINQIHHGYHSVESGDCFVVFNDSGRLEIGINQGNASQLLGLKYDSPVNLIFEG